MAQRSGDQSPAESVVFEERDGYLEARFPAVSSFDLVKPQIQIVLKHCAEKKPASLLVDLMRVTGTYSTLDRYDVGMMASLLTPHVGKVALVLPGALVDPQQFGAQVARNRGLKIELFLEHRPALDWLLG